MTVDKIEAKGIVKLVSASELEKASREGWKIIAVIKRQVAITVIAQVPDPHSQYGGCPLNVQQPMTVEEVHFLVELDEESSLTRLAEQVRSLSAELIEAQEHHKSEQEVSAEFAEKLRKSKLECSQWRGCAESRYEDIEQLQKLSQKMERDLGRVREVLGSRKMDEILAEEK